MTTLIEINGLTKQYGDKTVVNNVDLSVQAGEILGLVGPNGAGKTSCLQALLGLIQAQGNIDILGFDPSKQRAKMLEQVAYIADVAVLPKWLKVQQALDYMEDIHPRFNREKAEAFLAKTNIEDNAKVKTLSKGMVTQLHLALILAVDAQVLVLDEPTLGLDLLTRRQFYQHLLEDFYTADKCIVVTTHQIEEIEHILTDVAFIKDGKIVLCDSVDDVKQRFSMLAVDAHHKADALALNPVMANSMLGITTMLFDDADREKISAIGKVSPPSLADIFMGLMGQESVV